MKKVIIGAGPAGLYTAIKLRKAGIFDLVVYDPRAGHYTRPGHLNSSVFTKAQEGLDIQFWPKNEIGHIKDLEKALYKEAKSLGIKIENKRFIRLHEDAKKPGVVVQNEDKEEVVEADYVFDCTGARREVVSAVNKLVPDSPLQLTTITDLPVKNHFLAYVKINKTDWQQFQIDRELIVDFPETMDALSFTRSIIKLRELGWKELKLPRCYGVSFGKNKVCLYMHAPEHLSQENYDKWVQTVLECYTSPIHYDRLPSSSKPVFLPFTSSAQALKQVSYKGKNLPTVITLGDAQIDFDYVLAHGIRDGMGRIDALFEHMELFDNKIYYFDSVEYLNTINKLLRDHKDAVIKEAEEMRQSLSSALEIAQLKLRQAILLSNSPEEKTIIGEILKEIEARQSYVKARRVFNEYHTSSNQIKLTSTSLGEVINKLNQIQINLLKANSGLPASFATEQKDVQELLIHLAASWKEVGNALFKINNRAQAIDAYKKALEIYNLSDFSGKHTLKELPIYSNLAIVYLQDKLYSETIAAANTALSIFDNSSSTERPASLQEKIVFNLIKALCAQAQEFLLSKKHGDAKALHLQAKTIMSAHESQLNIQTLLSIKKIIDELQLRLPSRLDSSGENSRLDSPLNESLNNHGIFGGQSPVNDSKKSAENNNGYFF